METIFSFFWNIFLSLFGIIQTVWANLSAIINGAVTAFNAIIEAIGGFITWLIGFFGG